MRIRTVVPALGLVILLNGCLVGPPAGVVVAVRRPPPDRIEIINARPGPEFVWIRGHWNWAGGDYAWAGGRWERPIRGGRRYEQGRWRHYRGGYVWVEGGWR
ncbi:MAG: hypothetical protein ACHQXA_09280 [Gemmatimonadales bacterium]